jgi:predicted O-methyltransferase YrrM
MSPLPDMNVVKRLSERIYQSGVKHIPGVDLRDEDQIKFLNELSPLALEMPHLTDPEGDYRYSFDNYFFTGTDAILLYSLLRQIKPKRVVEIGSGFSSALMLDTAQAHPEIGSEFIFIEPQPERLESLLSDGDKQRCTILQQYLQDIDLTFFDRLESGDMIFVDTSHQMKVGSEVLYLIFHVMPRLKKGVLVHFHDVFWPFEYPKEWVEVGRSWNEAYGLRSFLQYNNEFEICFFNSYMGTVHQKSMEELFPWEDGEKSDASKWPGGNFNAGGSLWIRRK